MPRSCAPTQASPRPSSFHRRSASIPPRRPTRPSSTRSRRLRSSVAALTNPEFVLEHDAPIPGQPVEYAFGPVHLDGLKIFLAEPSSSPPSPAEIAQGGIGNCIACHSGPGFTDR
jgi:hypothetical protein